MMALRRKAILETPNRRKRRKQKIILRAALSLFCFGLLGVGVNQFFKLAAFQVTNVSVTGVNEVDPSMLKTEAESQASGTAFFFIPKRFVGLYPKQEIAAAIMANHSEIRSAQVSVRGLKDAEITISERTPEALYCATLCFYIDKDGLVYRKASSSADYIIFRDARPEALATSTVSINTHPLEASAFKDVLYFSKKIADLGLHFMEIVIEPNDDLKIETQEGTLLISDKEPLSDQFEFLKTALSQQMFKNTEGSVHSFNYIDLRFGKKIFYRMNSAPSAAAATSSATSTIVQ